MKTALATPKLGVAGAFLCNLISLKGKKAVHCAPIFLASLSDFFSLVHLA